MTGDGAARRPVRGPPPLSGGERGPCGIERLEAIEHRVDGFEPFPPTLATRDELQAAERRIRTHFGVVAERNDIRPVAEAVAVLATYRRRRAGLRGAWTIG